MKNNNLPAPVPVRGKYGGTSTPISTPWASLVSRRPEYKKKVGCQTRHHDEDESVATKLQQACNMLEATTKQCGTVNCKELWIKIAFLLKKAAWNFSEEAALVFKDLRFLYIHPHPKRSCLPKVYCKSWIISCKALPTRDAYVHRLHDWLLPLCCELIFLTSKFVFRDAGGLGGSRVDTHSVTWWTQKMLTSCRTQIISKSMNKNHKSSSIKFNINLKWKPGCLITIGKKTTGLLKGLIQSQFSARHMKFLKLKFNRSKPDKKGDILRTHTDNAASKVFEVWCISLCYELWTHSFTMVGGGQAFNESKKCSKME